jgi:diguanylate cyclase (GGDEF)-like protein
MTEVAPQVDLLTGAFRRPWFEHLVARAVADARRRSLPLSLVHLDLDELQEHNDLHGQGPLDEVIGAIASRISAVVDGRGPIGRVAGGAFAVCLLGLSREQARGLAEQLHLGLSGPALPFGLTVSIGVATLRPAEVSGNLLEAAEQACLHAKQAGRDAVVSR